ncbi:MAG: ATP-binding protein [Bacteroidota bacterium]|nr:ATP-binding protein [Bacteroidota bacterium]
MLPDGKIIKVNETFISWTGFSVQKITQEMNITDLFSNGGKLYYHMFYAPLLQLQAKVNEISFDIYRNDGSCFPGLLNANAVKDRSERIVAINVSVTDITDRKKYERELLNAKTLAEAQKNNFETVAAYIPEMIWTSGGNGRINYVNKRFADFFGIAQTNEASMRIDSLIHPEDRLTAKRTWLKGISSGQEFRIQLRLRTSSEEYNWYLFKGTPYVGVNQQIERWLGSCLNIHEHITEIERRDEFISIASHELKTPITSLNLSLQILRSIKSGLTDKQISLVEQASRNAKKIHALIDDLLNVKRLTEGQLALYKRRFSLYKLIFNCKNSFPADAQALIKIIADSSMELVADEHRIEQVIINFINNALKYAPGSVITISAEQQRNRTKISVADKGPGIPESKVSHIFERYYRADHSGLEYSGLGLGLYICAEIIKRHDGHIGVETRPGEGSNFWFELRHSSPNG